ncbi:hypothetical protein [Antarcticirhabdus aurantiaca]|uniref:Uncharacterized protein n=1 Tax=Antarcticirhabdus aurantiaca TaxID=2606717 RepID=A0ACD4NIX8_9HYPH|nr:hypothetical protein [Antarcticirhabdus aurantiaca]WAJ26830.1 hypothetical protein OXU80_18440 [Jeongeuplla avenae]
MSAGRLATCAVALLLTSTGLGLAIVHPGAAVAWTLSTTIMSVRRLP